MHEIAGNIKLYLYKEQENLFNILQVLRVFDMESRLWYEFEAAPLSVPFWPWKLFQTSKTLKCCFTHTISLQNIPASLQGYKPISIWTYKHHRKIWIQIFNILRLGKEEKNVSRYVNAYPQSLFSVRCLTCGKSLKIQVLLCTLKWEVLDVVKIHLIDKVNDLSIQFLISVHTNQKDKSSSF